MNVILYPITYSRVDLLHSKLSLYKGHVWHHVELPHLYRRNNLIYLLIKMALYKRPYIATSSIDSIQFNRCPVARLTCSCSTTSAMSCTGTLKFYRPFFVHKNSLKASLRSSSIGFLIVSQIKLLNACVIRAF